MTPRILVCELVVEGNPVPKGRPRVSAEQRYVNGQLRLVSVATTPKRTAQAEERLGWLVKAALPGGFPVAAPFAVEARFFERREPPQLADVDNLQKLVGDALNGVVWEDDAQVVEWAASIERGARRPRTELRIWQLEVA
jgi:crossover junction endodeoxyribonuclease RusA